VPSWLFVRAARDLKDEAHYGVLVVSARKARDAHRWATRLVERAAQETER
jgi:hypothetical protein